ncbi:NUDIX hydrolase [Dactylosporangium sp. NPDC051541]|uniref:NUDIX hydrolase n=1 Tax=Dactylosporangium sp. NPDC051541 TaxID=3363977 RepID=UPI0037A28305
MADSARPYIGVQAIVRQHRQPRTILLGLRKNVFGDGHWGLPGGHLEFGESFEAAARRELIEETGIAARQLYVWKLVNTPYRDTHYVQIGVQVARYQGQIRNLEPEKCAGLRWWRLDDLPTPLFEPSVPFLDALRERDRLPGPQDAVPSLAIFLFCAASNGRASRYISYLALGQSPQVFLRMGLQGERRERQLRQFTVDSPDDALDLLRADIGLRLQKGYCLYDVRGSYTIEQVRSLFPSGSVAYRAIRGASDPLSREELALHRELQNGYAQLSLFETDAPFVEL